MENEQGVGGSMVMVEPKLEGRDGAGSGKDLIKQFVGMVPVAAIGPLHDVQYAWENGIHELAELTEKYSGDVLVTLCLVTLAGMLVSRMKKITPSKGTLLR